MTRVTTTRAAAPAAATILAAILAAVLPAAPALAEATGPDAWRVRGVAPGDVLNVRMGPGTDYPTIGAFAPDARHLRAETCVPLSTFAQHQALTAAERRALPPRWCLVDGGQAGRGWVAQRFLAEDVAASPPRAATPAQGPAVAPPHDIAVPLVRNLYDRAIHSGGRLDLADPQTAGAWFFADVARRLGGGGADPLFDAQDTDISGLSVAFDPAQPVLRGTARVIVRFENFGSPRRAVAYLRADPARGGAIRIFRIEHQSGAVID